MTTEQLRLALRFIQEHITFVNPAIEGMTVDRLLGIASALAKNERVDALVIDPWNELSHNTRPPHMLETEYISITLTKIRRWARKHNAHVFLVVHPAKMQKNRESGKYDVPQPYDVSGSAHWRNKADYALCIHRDITEGDQPEVGVYVQKVRRREIGRVGRVILHYDKVTGSYIDPVTPRRCWEDR
jgi:twinkle protein